MTQQASTYRSGHLEVFNKKGVYKNFSKFTGKHLCQSLFLIKLQAGDEVFIEHLRKAVSVCKMDCPEFPCEFGKIFKNIFFTEYLREIASIDCHNQQ